MPKPAARRPVRKRTGGQINVDPVFNAAHKATSHYIGNGRADNLAHGQHMESGNSALRDDTRVECFAGINLPRSRRCAMPAGNYLLGIWNRSAATVGVNLKRIEVRPVKMRTGISFAPFGHCDIAVAYAILDRVGSAQSRRKLSKNLILHLLEWQIIGAFKFDAN
jgi:hypothetical protein